MPQCSVYGVTYRIAVSPGITRHAFARRLPPFLRRPRLALSPSRGRRAACLRLFTIAPRRISVALYYGVDVERQIVNPFQRIGVAAVDLATLEGLERLLHWFRERVPNVPERGFGRLAAAADHEVELLEVVQRHARRVDVDHHVGLAPFQGRVLAGEE